MPLVDTSEKIYDFAGILTAEEQDRLAESAKNSASARGADFVILTVTDDLGLGMVDFSDEFYEGNGFGGDKFDGVMLYINMVERDVYVATYGDVVRMFSAGDIDYILDVTAPLLSGGRYYEACESFIILASGHIAEKKSMSIAAGAAASVLAGAVVSMIMLMTHSRSMSPKPGINTYFSGRGFRLTNRSDVFLHTNTTRTPIPQNTGGGGGGGGGAHRTSGGRSAGGGGRKF